MIPLLIGGVAAVAGKLIYDAVTEDNSSSSSSNDSYEREREARERENEKNEKKLLIDINQYKKEEIRCIEEKYQSEIHIDTLESFSDEVHNILKNTSLSMLNHLTSKFGKSFISLNGTINNDIIDKHIEELENIFKNKISEITFADIEDFDNIEIEKIIGLDIEMFFSEDLDDITELLELYEYDTEIDILNRIRRVYHVEKTYQKFLSTCRKFHKLLKSEETLKKIEQYITNNINDYQDNFDSYKVTLIDKDKTLVNKIALLEKEKEELKEVIHTLRMKKDARLK